MAVVKVAATHTYTGASTDSKPTSGVPAGSIFWEFTEGTPPTVRQFMFDGTGWGLVTETAAAS